MYLFINIDNYLTNASVSRYPNIPINQESDLKMPRIGTLKSDLQSRNQSR